MKFPGQIMTEHDAHGKGGARWGKVLRLPRTLSGRLLLLTLSFVMLAEVLIYVPSIANYRVLWLESRLAAAQIASLALEATMGEEVSPALESELLDNVGALQISLQRNETHMLMLTSTSVPMVQEIYDLRDSNPFTLIHDAFSALVYGGSRTIIVKGTPRLGGGELIEVILDEHELREAMLIYSRNILSLSLMISFLTAVLVFISFRTIFVQPMRHLIQNMVEFSEHPEDAGRIIRPSSWAEEIRLAEQELADLQTGIRNSLNQKAHLAELGAAVSKINHDLRNILASAQLISDSLATSEDPRVQRLAPKLLSSIDRAIDLTTKTLKYGKAEEPPPKKTLLDLATLVDDVGDHVGLPDDGRIQWVNEVTSPTEIVADPDQLFRVLLNLGRNATQAMESEKGNGLDKTVTIRAAKVQLNGSVAIVISVQDTGPGIPERARAHLFEAFSGSVRQGGTGLGLAIARELTQAHGGSIELVRSDENGTVFEITLPAMTGEEARQ